MAEMTPEELRTGYDVAKHGLRDLQEDLLARWLPSPQSLRAREYLAHGVVRRMRILLRCVENVFTICPVDRVELLNCDELTDLQINLHAFVINVHGLLDNLAWVTVFEKAPDGFLDRRSVWLFNPKLRPHLPTAAQQYLGEPDIVRWFEKYARDYRDALAHRIPLYVPPSGLDEADSEKYAQLESQLADKLKERDFEGFGALPEKQGRLGKIFPVFQHSFGDPDASEPIAFHPQLVADMNTISAIVRVVAPPTASPGGIGSLATDGRGNG